MKRSLVEIYGLAVCFFTVACFVIVLGIAMWDVIELASPEFTMDNSTYEQHQSDEAYRDYLVRQHRCDDKEKNNYVPPEGASLKDARERSYAQELRLERRKALQDLLKEFIILLIDIVVFVVHWKIATHARKSSS